MLIRTVSRYPGLTAISIIVGAFLLYGAYLVISRVITNPDHVVVTVFEVFERIDDGGVLVTVNRVTYHPATKVRGLFTRQADAVARPEYVQIDGTIAMSVDAPSPRMLAGPASIVVGPGESVEREVRTRGNSCFLSSWPPMAIQLTELPSDFTIRIPVRGSAVAESALESIRNGLVPVFTLRGLHQTSQECEPFDSLTAGPQHEISIGPINAAPGVKHDFYPYGEPRFREPGDDDRPRWSEWARGWVPGEF